MSSDERSPERSERPVQYEFKVIVHAPENAWPTEVRDDIKRGVEVLPNLRVMSVEQVRDY